MFAPFDDCLEQETLQWKEINTLKTEYYTTHQIVQQILGTEV